MTATTTATTTVTAHVRALLRAGWTQQEIADACGLERRTIHSVVHIERPTVQRYTADALLALDPQDAPHRVSPVASIRRVTGLAAIGWTLASTAAAAELHEQFVRDLVAGRCRRIDPAQAAAIQRVCRARFLTPGPSKCARTIAAKHGWLPVTVWDDIDDPACKPDVPARQAAA